MNMDKKSQEAITLMGIIISSIATAIFGCIKAANGFKAQDELDDRLNKIEDNIAEHSGQLQVLNYNVLNSETADDPDLD